MNVVLHIILPVFGILLIGYGAACFKLLDRAGIKGISLFVFNIAIPVMLFRSMLNAELPARIPWAYLITYYGCALLLFGFCYLTARKVLHQKFANAGMFAFGCSYSNMIPLGIPLVLTAFGEAAAVPLFILVSLQSIVMFPALTTILEINRNSDVQTGTVIMESAKGVITNPYIVALMLGLTANWVELPLPQTLDRLFDMLGAAAIPCALFAMGASLSQHQIVGEISLALVITVIKTIVQPVLVWLLATYCFKLEPVWIAVATLLAGLPTGINLYLFSQRYNAAIPMATTTVVISTGVSVLTLSVVLGFLSRTVPG